ncbi:hypothetical protein [Leekyejoonella antrihumi]|uniref:Glycine-rich domain-containing protein n=1 Tax=Leekyejoonella antrihumi TaxID=1660198 RepID=A0A563DQL9_9MICO|nr:hypothetical protein [Leekyejoonella antrihumi]TWP32486.1 hypothetical protein FGL98_24070 [Leekyejoonella antrihumi]
MKAIRPATMTAAAAIVLLATGCGTGTMIHPSTPASGGSIPARGPAKTPTSAPQIFTASGNFHDPAGVHRVLVEAIGGGGGGGSVTVAANTCSGSGAGGGGQGGDVRASVPVTPGTAYTIRIGAAGAAGSVCTSGAQAVVLAATAGGASTFAGTSGRLVTASGGAGGSSPNGTAGGGGGIGGAGSAASSVTAISAAPKVNGSPGTGGLGGTGGGGGGQPGFAGTGGAGANGGFNAPVGAARAGLVIITPEA